MFTEVREKLEFSLNDLIVLMVFELQNIIINILLTLFQLLYVSKYLDKMSWISRVFQIFITNLFGEVNEIS